MNIVEFLADYAPGRDPESWAVWNAILRAASALEMSEHDRALFWEVARREPPEGPVRQIWAKCGRSSGKTETAAAIVVHKAVCRDYRKILSPGEFATCMLLAADREQAKIALDRVRGLFDGSPRLRQMVVRETRDGFELNNQSRIEVFTSNYRSVRGRSLACAVLDEVAFWRDRESVNPDVEVYTAVLPGLAKVPDSLLVATSTPHLRSGLLWEVYDRFFGQDDPNVLVVEGTTELFNPTIDRLSIEASRAADPANATAEWDAEFRSDLESFIALEVVRALVVDGRKQLAPVDDKSLRYVAGVDPSGGGSDSFTLAVAHNDPQSGRAILDTVRSKKPPFSPESVVKEFCDVLRWYEINEVHGDEYAGKWPAEMFGKYGVNYRPIGKSKSALYLDLLPYLNGGAVELLDNDALVMELAGLERSPVRGGPDKVDHRKRAHDDLINSAAIALCEAIGPAWAPKFSDFWVADQTVAADLQDCIAGGMTPAEAIQVVQPQSAAWGNIFEPDYSGSLGPYIQ